MTPRKTTTPGVYIEEIPSGIRKIDGAPTSVTAFVGEMTRGPRTKAVEISSMADFEKEFGRGSLVHTAVFLFFANGGRRAVIVRQRDPGLKAFFQALHALDEVQDVNILCLPSREALEADKLYKAAQYCEERRMFFLLDPDPAWNLQTDFANALNQIGVHSPNAALYFPGFLGGGTGIPPGGAIAGVFARIDQAHGVWKSPAGTEAGLHSVRGLTAQIPQQLRENLNPLGINSLIEIPNTGPVIWGARTLAGNDNEWRYIAVRRTALFIEESIDRSTRWTVFEPNDANLWQALSLSVHQFLAELFRQGAFAGSSPKEAYWLRCDNSTMTQNDIQAGRVNLVLGFAPLKPAEFVVLNFTFKARQP